MSRKPSRQNRSILRPQERMQTATRSGHILLARGSHRSRASKMARPTSEQDNG